MGKRLAVVPLTLFGKVDDPLWKPQHHMYYDDRVMDIEDDLPKYKGSTRHELWVPRKDNPQESVEETREQ